MEVEFACPQGGLKGLGIALCTLCSGVFWAVIIINGSALQPHVALLGYGLTGVAVRARRCDAQMTKNAVNDAVGVRVR